jgi:pre-mRNA-splicing factor ISY1
VDDNGREAPGTQGYRYFGRARELPGVQELFAQHKQTEDVTSEEADIQRGHRIQLDAEYYGLLDDEDETLIAEEQRVEEEMLKALQDEAMQVA